MTKKRLVLIDGHAMLYRAFYAFPATLTTRDKQPINAVYGFTRILLSVLKDLTPDYIAVSFDVGKTFRHDEFASYKAQRKPMPDELKSQEPLAYEAVKALGIPIHTKDGFEADDVIGTIAWGVANNRLHVAEGEVEVVIVTGDVDALQLVQDPSEGSEQVAVFMPGSAKRPPIIYDEKAVEAKIGLTPKQIADYKGLAGDTSDNIPGVAGIGPKTAVGLLKEFGTVEGVYEHIDEVPSKAVKAKLEKDKQAALDSKRLATIVTDVPLDFDLDDCIVSAYDKKKAQEVFLEFGFRSLINDLPNDQFEDSVQEALF